MNRLPCSSCGAPETKVFRGKAIDISHRGVSVKVKGLNGFLCTACGDVRFDPKSAKRYAEAGDKLVTK